TMNAFLHDAYKPEHVDGFRTVLDPVMASMEIPFADMRDAITTELTTRAPLTHDTWTRAVGDLRKYMGEHRTKAQGQVDLACAGSTADAGAPPDAGSPPETDASTDAPSNPTDGGTP